VAFALALFASQIGRVTGMSITAHGFIRPFVELAGRTDEIHGPTLALAAGLFILLRIMRLAMPRVPGPLVAVAPAIALSILLGLSGKGVALVGEIATGLPTVVLPDLRGMVSEEFALGAIGIFVVSFTSGIVTVRSFATRNRYRIDADRELIGFGAANIAAGLFGGFPVTGADSRTAINDALGGKTQVAGLVAAVSLALSLLFLTGLLVHLPIAALGAVLASAAVDLFDSRALINIWRINRVEFVFALIAILGVVAFGVLAGIIVAVFATLIWLVGAAAPPRDACSAASRASTDSTSCIGAPRPGPSQAWSSTCSRGPSSSSTAIICVTGSAGSSIACRRKRGISFWTPVPAISWTAQAPSRSARLPSTWPVAASAFRSSSCIMAPVSGCAARDFWAGFDSFNPTT
jgi:MFS superfamily sulfate permease-like transporter